jgi:hypothetical protein
MGAGGLIQNRLPTLSGSPQGQDQTISILPLMLPEGIASIRKPTCVGLGLIGTVLAQASRSLASGIAFSGAGFSVYSNFIARGQDVVLPVNTPVKVSLRARGGPESPGPDASAGW